MVVTWFRQGKDNNMKLIMKMWNLFLEQEENYSQDKKSILYLGSGRSQKPERYKNRFQSWEHQNKMGLEIRSYEGSSSHDSNLEKIIGFSAGARKAILLAKDHPEAQLVLLDPWIGSTDLKVLLSMSTNLEFRGPSKYLLKLKNGPSLKRNLLKLGLIPENEKGSGDGKFNSHLKYLNDYFKLGG